MKDEIFQACLTAIEQGGWKNFSFAKAAAQSGLPLSTFHNHFSCSTEVITFLFHKIDQEVLKNIQLSEDLISKDALFEILMARFDAAHPYKAVLQSFWKEWVYAPEETPALISHGFSSMAWMLEAAGLESRGLKGFLRTQGLATLYLLTLRTWLTDDSPDLGKTMAFLDKGLSRAEKMASYMNRSPLC